MTLEEQWLQKKERLLAWLRLGFSLVAILVTQLNPGEKRFPILYDISVFSFFVYSIIVLLLILWERLDSRKISLWTSSLDLVWIFLIDSSTIGSRRTPFFVYYLFPVMTASSRYGIKGSLLVAFAGLFLYGATRFSPFWPAPIRVDTFIIRSIYLVALAYIFGFISEFEKQQNQKLMALNKTAAQAALHDERRRIARELHDRLLQVLATLKLRLEVSRRQLIENPRELAREFELMEEAAANSMQEIRGFLAGKDTNALIPGTLMERLKEEMRFLRDGLGLRVVMETTPEDFRLLQEVEQEVYYVLREGIINVARHSQASELTLLLEQTEGALKGSLRDNGLGFDPTVKSNGTSYGLESMRERIEKLGGHLAIETAPGKGTEISFVVPLKNRDESAAT